MTSRIYEIAANSALVAIVTYLIYVPGRVVWESIGDLAGTHSGELVMILIMIGFCAGSAVIFSLVTGVRLQHLIIGGILVYIPWLIYLEVTAGPFDSPVHIFLGVLFLIGFTIGGYLAEWSESRDLLRHGTGFQ